MIITFDRNTDKDYSMIDNQKLSVSRSNKAKQCKLPLNKLASFFLVPLVIYTTSTTTTYLFFRILK